MLFPKPYTYDKTEQIPSNIVNAEQVHHVQIYYEYIRQINMWTRSASKTSSNIQIVKLRGEWRDGKNNNFERIQIANWDLRHADFKHENLSRISLHI